MRSPVTTRTCDGSARAAAAQKISKPNAAACFRKFVVPLMECARAKQLASLAFPFGADNGASSFGKICAISREDAAARERVVQIAMRYSDHNSLLKARCAVQFSEGCSIGDIARVNAVPGAHR